MILEADSREQAWSERICRAMKVEEDLKPEFDRRRQEGASKLRAERSVEEARAAAQKGWERRRAGLGPQPHGSNRARPPEKGETRAGIAAASEDMPYAAFECGKRVMRAVFTDPDHYGELVEVLDLHGPYKARSRMEELDRMPLAKDNPNAIVGQVIANLEGLTAAIKDVPVERLHPHRRKEWDKTFRDCLRVLESVERRMR